MPKNESFVAVHLEISGRVQGVGFRYFADSKAQQLGLKGWVRNTDHGSVEAEVEGPKEAVELWVELLKRGPSMAQIDQFRADWRAYDRRFTNFTIR